MGGIAGLFKPEIYMMDKHVLKGIPVLINSCGQHKYTCSQSGFPAFLEKIPPIYWLHGFGVFYYKVIEAE
jgi:hypothetical protein